MRCRRQQASEWEKKYEKQDDKKSNEAEGSTTNEMAFVLMRRDESRAANGSRSWPGFVFLALQTRTSRLERGRVAPDEIRAAPGIRSWHGFVFHAVQTRTSCLEQGRVAPYAAGSSDELCDRLMPNGTTRTTSWTTSTSSSTTEENSEITGRKSWIAKSGTDNQLEMTGHGNDNEGNQQPVHQDNSLPECLPELIPEELCCHPCPPTLPRTPVRISWLHSAP